MVRGRVAERLDPWLAGVLASPWRELKRFAQGLRQDYAAVQAALTSRYSNGPTGCDRSTPMRYAACCSH